ncbi:MAG: valine--tRNA ligase [Bacteroidales bacterium]|nr:valine--tRNA ligase [Bacteroidales bacterium]
MEIPSRYNPAVVESKWYDYWMRQGFFHSKPDDSEPYCIVIPPPNVTGVLHMGHMLNNTIQDILVRKARMSGKNACWVPGTDHASIATEAKVVAKLKEEGIDKSELTREEFLEHAWTWKEKHGGIILEQLKKLGASCDWDRTCFTMDEARYASVIDVFIDLYDKGLIYRGARMVNWDPGALTAISDEEVIYKEVQSKLYHVRYRIEGADDAWVTIATTRPETILGDTAICVHPDDDRYAHLKGKRILIPLINRSVPVIFDDYVEMEFGTGALKVTPAHDLNDYNLGLRHNLEVVDTFNPDGTLSEAAQLYIGEDRFVVRTKIVTDLDAAGHIVKIEEYINKIGYSERTDEVIEPRISVQWFLKMKELAPPALEVVENDTIRFHPAKYKNMYRHWMENVQDWCISRQLWWGQRIPAWYLPDGTVIVAKTKEEAFEKAKLAVGSWQLAENRPQSPVTSHESRVTSHESRVTVNDLQQDPDVMDTWFSSWLWPISVFDGIRKPDNPDINYYYPTNDLVTAPEIIFFWVARMIMAGLEYRNDIPFHNVYFTGIVRDKLGRKMSKSLGNSPEPLQLIDQYGADAVRMGMLLCSPAGNDLLFDEGLIEQGRNFCNKVWNAFRLVKGWQVDENPGQPQACRVAVAWFESQFAQSLKEIEELFVTYRLSEALMAIYKLFWDDFCAWYLEMVKPAYQQPIDPVTYQASVDFFDKLIRLLHPFLPFITEEIWQLLNDRKEGESIMISSIPDPGSRCFTPLAMTMMPERGLLKSFEFAREVVTAIRTVRKEKNLPQKEMIRLMIKKNNDEPVDMTFDEAVMKLCGIDELAYVEEKQPQAFSFVVRTTEFYIPLAGQLNVEEELNKLQEELKYTRGFLASVEKKLSNDRFVNNAPQKVVALEQKKKADAEARIKVLEEKLKELP